MKVRKIPGTHQFWAIESNIFGLLPYTIREKMSESCRCVAIDKNTWRAFRRKGIYKLVRINCNVSRVSKQTK